MEFLIILPSTQLKKQRFFSLAFQFKEDHVRCKVNSLKHTRRKEVIGALGCNMTRLFQAFYFGDSARRKKSTYYFAVMSGAIFLH